MRHLYRLLLRAYPVPVRRAFGRDMAELFADMLREERHRGGRLAVGTAAARTFLELPFSAWRAHRAQAPAPPPSGRRSAGIEVLMQSFRHSLRNLKNSPGFAAVVVLTLAIGIGANTVMFTVLDGILLSPLPYEEPDRLVRLYSANPERWSGVNYVPGLAFLAYRERTDIFASLASAYSYREVGADLTRGDETRRIVTMPVSAGYFDVLGIAPLMGRGFRPEEETADAAVAVISHGLWQAAFGGDPEVLGKDIELEGRPHAVVGVMPAGFRNPVDWQVDLWRPENLQPGGRNSWGNYYLSVIGKLRDGVSMEAAQEELEALGAAMFAENPDTNGAYGAIFPLLDDTVGETAPMLWVLMAAVAMVLLIACVNVASLYLVRSAERGKELAIRAALGAARRRLVAQLLGESLVLGIAGGAAGFLLAFVGLRAIIAMGPTTLPRAAELGIDLRVFGFATAVSLLTGLLFGVVPALRFSRPDLERALRDGSRGSAGSGQRRLRGALVVAEISIALVLLFGAGLLAKSFTRLLDVDLGVRRDGILTYEIHLPASRYPEAQDRVAFYQRFFERVGGIPGVEAVGATSYLPTEGRYHIWGMGRTDQDLDDNESWTSTDVRVIDGDYLDIMGVRLVRGRTFSAADTLDPPWPGLINESLAALAFPDHDPLGAVVAVGGDAFRIVGIVSDTAYDTRGSTSPKFYIRHDHFAADRNWAMIQTVRTSLEPTSIVGQLRSELRTVDPQLVLYRVRTFQDVVASGVSAPRFAMALMSGFAAVALLLAAIGIYGVLSYTVSQRTREIGIRMALGADRGSVRRMVLGQGLLLTGFGLLAGAAGALALTGWLSSLLFEVEPGDPAVLATVAALLIAVAAAAGYLPTRRATSVDPIQALHEE